MENIEEFLETRFGWIIPYGKLLACEQYGHEKTVINFMVNDKSEMGMQ